MAEFTTTYTVNRPACDSDRIVKIGFRNGEQRYLCRGCKKKFQANGKAPGRRMDAEMMGSAIRDYYTGKSYKQVAEGLKEEYDLPNEPSKATIYEWVRDYTDQALKKMEGHKAQTGGHWVADEMRVKVGGKKMWLWNVMDSETRYILASHLTPRRDANAARVVLRKAAQDHHHGQAPVLSACDQVGAARGPAYPVGGAAGRHQQQPFRKAARHIQKPHQDTQGHGQPRNRATLP